MTFWEILDSLIEEAKLTNKSFAAAVNIMPQSIDVAKRRGSSPTIKNATKYLNVLDYDLVIVKHGQAPEGSFILGSEDTTPKQNLINQKLERIGKEQEELQKELDSLLNSKE